MILARWTSMVRGEIPSSRPASLLEAPCAIWSSTSTSRAVSVSAPGKSRSVGERLVLRLRSRCTRTASRTSAITEFGVKGLLDEVVRAGLDRGDGHRDVALARDHDDWRRIMIGADRFEHIEPRAGGHVDIEQQAIGLDSLCDSEEFVPAPIAPDLKALHFEDGCEGVANSGVIIDYRNVERRLPVMTHPLPPRFKPDDVLLRNVPIKHWD